MTARSKARATKKRPRRRADRPRRPVEVAAPGKLLELEVQRLDQELACAALFDPADILDPETGATLPVHQWPQHARRALAGFEEEALLEDVPTGKVGPRGGAVKARVQVGVVRKFKWQDKTAAQRLAFQRLGALVERHEIKESHPEPDISDEEWEALAKLRHELRPNGAAKRGDA